MALFFLARMSLFYGQTDTQNVTKYARNDSFIKKIAMKMILLLSKRVKTKAVEGWRCFF